MPCSYPPIPRGHDEEERELARIFGRREERERRHQFPIPQEGRREGGKSWEMHKYTSYTAINTEEKAIQNTTHLVLS